MPFEASNLSIQTAIDVSGVSAVLNRPSPLPAIPIQGVGLGPVVIEQEGTDGELIRINQSDERKIIVWVKDLIDENGDPVEPKSGDRWTLTLPSGKQIQAKCLPFRELPAVHFFDRYETAFAIHLKIQR